VRKGTEAEAVDMTTTEKCSLLRAPDITYDVKSPINLKVDNEMDVGKESELKVRPSTLTVPSLVPCTSRHRNGESNYHQYLGPSISAGSADKTQPSAPQPPCITVVDFPPNEASAAAHSPDKDDGDIEYVKVCLGTETDN
jgi:hypothetical protein